MPSFDNIFTDNPIIYWLKRIGRNAALRLLEYSRKKRKLLSCLYFLYILLISLFSGRLLHPQNPVPVNKAMDILSVLLYLFPCEI